MKKLLYLSILTFICAASASAQLVLPRESQRQEIIQIVGDTRIAVVYHRPNTKGRANIFGCASTDVVPIGGKTYDCLVPNGQVWRTGANENTTIEFSNDVMINGLKLPAGKYGLHTIPNKDEWVVIFSKDNAKWGSYSYDVKQDQLRVTTKPQMVESQETMSLGFENVKLNTAEVVVRWDKMRVPFTVDIGDMQPRVLNYIREQMKTAKTDEAGARVAGANYVYSNKMTANYAEALTWLDALQGKGETYNALALKANLLAETGKTAEAIVAGEKAMQVAQTMSNKPNTANLEKKLADWKAKK
jgi:hypothetical protein